MLVLPTIFNVKIIANNLTYVGMKTITYYILGNDFSYHYLLYFRHSFKNCC